MSTVAYHCKMCGCEGQAQMDCSPEELAARGFSLAFWVSLLTCNRCYDFREDFKWLRNNILRVCAALEVSSKSKREKINTAVRDQLIEQTKRIVRLLADHYRQQNVWDEQIVDGLMDKPQDAAAQLSHLYHAIQKGLWASATQPELVK